MKSRTSFFNATALRKNLIRFTPAWGLYGLFLLLVVLNSGTLNEWDFAEGMQISIVLMAVVNFFYALLCTQLIFGDLYDSRMCNALHAMPLRREGWFLTNVVSGLLFSLIPNAATTLISLVICGEFWMTPILWLCAVTMQFLFFFGVAVFSGYLVGNRFAMALVYFILNGFSIILYWLVFSIFEPMLYGVTIPADVFVDFCPVVKLCTFEYVYVSFAGWNFETGWVFLGLCMGLGIVALGLALLCYRKRNLETAGDFAATKPVGIVFLILYTICGGACCHGFFSIFVGDENEIFLYLGLAIGFFTGLMLLKRTVKVFRLKSFLGFGAVVLAMILSVVIVRTDLLGIVGWLPKTDEIASVSITTYRVTGDRLTLTEAEDLEKILQIHRYGLENRNAGSDSKRDTKVTLTYTLKSGAVRQREYYVNVGTACGDMLRFYLSRPEMVLGDIYGKLDEFKLQGVELPDGKAFIVSAEALRALMDAIEADCAGGDLAQDWAYTEDYGDQYWINLRFVNEEGMHHYTDIVFTQASTNLMMWYRTQLDILESVNTTE
jgi:ABC-2 type transport system permease protein